jgi:hypothetical protein
MANNQGGVNFIALLNGMAEELGIPVPTYHPDQPPAIGLIAAICRFGNASASGSGQDVYSARNAAACIMWSNLGNGVRVDNRYHMVYILQTASSHCVLSSAFA